MANLRVDKITSTETFEKTGSVQFDGSGDYLSSSTIISGTGFGTNDFTIDFWIYPANANSGNYTGILNLKASTTADRFQVAYHSSSIQVYTDTRSWRDTGFVPNISSWTHISFVRNYSGNTLKMYANGVEKWSVSNNHDYDEVFDDVWIGRHSGQSTYLNGFISNIRIVNGTALYTENFKPPMRELEVVPGTVLLACQSKTDTTLEKTGKTITVNGNAIASELTPGILTPVPKSGGGSAITGSVEFTSTTDALVLSAGEDFAYGTGDFTIEAWIQPQGINGGETKAIFTQTQSGNDYIVFKVDSDKAIKATFGSTTVSGGTVEVGSWHHVAVTRASNTVKIFVNGVASAGTTVSTDFSDTTRNPTIGQYTHTYGNIEYYGFISNFRIVKGTALYTDSFIPPTRELKKVPGTVLLCCQDPDNPLTEATGKTITPYGNLGDGSLGPELVTNNSVWTMACGGSGCSNWTASNNGRSLAGTTVTSGYIRATYTLSKGDYLVSLRWTGGAFAVQDSNGYIVATDGTDTEFAADEDGAYSFYMSDTTSVVITGTTWNQAYTVDDISIKRIYKNNGGSNFTPQVGDDRKVTFEGVTKINSDAYFYLPTGDTTSRETTGTYNAGTRGIFGGGFVGPGSSDHRDTIQFINIASKGNATDAGDLTVSRYGNAALASATRAVWAGGIVPTPAIYNTIDAVEIMSTGNAFDFGDLPTAVYYPAGFSNRTRGIYSGGASPTLQATLSYITISSKGNTQDFGDMGDAKNSHSTFSSPTRGVVAGGWISPVRTNIMEYVTIASTGNVKDFGDLTRAHNYAGGCSSAIRGLTAGGNAGNPSTVSNIIDYVTISAMGNAVDFGDLTSARAEVGSCSSATRGVFAGAWSPSKVNTIDYVSIQTTGNAKDFGDLVNIGVMQEMGTSNGHGGLG